MLALKEIIVDFLKKVKENEIEIYNEFSLQHELGIYLRNKLPSYKVQFERNVSFFNINTETTKKEIDLVIFTHDKKEKYAIELKYPLNGQYPEQMYSFVKDIKFMEELKELGFTKTCCVVLVKDKKFYEGKEIGIYKFFRKECSVYGKIYKPTGKGKNKEYVSLNNKYDFQWENLEKFGKFYIIEI